MTRIIFTTKSKKISINKNEQFVIFDILLDGDIERNIEVNLIGEGASVEIYGLFFGIGEQKFKSSHIVRHKASYTTSKLLTKGVLDGKAKTEYNSLIDIKEGSVGCKAEQKEDTLLLSREAHIDAVPALEIANDDVQASHSVSTTYIDEIKKFYLESRGMSEDGIIKTIVLGHFSDVLDRIEDKIKIENKILQRLSYEL
jgi:Fe-S cluster assembly scaffold protein SufB